MPTGYHFVEPRSTRRHLPNPVLHSKPEHTAVRRPSDAADGVASMGQFMGSLPIAPYDEDATICHREGHGVPVR